MLFITIISDKQLYSFLEQIVVEIFVEVQQEAQEDLLRQQKLASLYYDPLPLILAVGFDQRVGIQAANSAQFRCEVGKHLPLRYLPKLGFD
jgi:hypothetical protein